MFITESDDAVSNRLAVLAPLAVRVTTARGIDADKPPHLQNITRTQ